MELRWVCYPASGRRFFRDTVLQSMQQIFAFHSMLLKNFGNWYKSAVVHRRIAIGCVPLPG
jgi:hypothetical protein